MRPSYLDNGNHMLVRRRLYIETAPWIPLAQEHLQVSRHGALYIREWHSRGQILKAISHQVDFLIRALCYLNVR